MKQTETTQKISNAAPETLKEATQAGPSRKRSRRRHLSGW